MKAQLDVIYWHHKHSSLCFLCIPLSGITQVIQFHKKCKFIQMNSFTVLEMTFSTSSNLRKSDFICFSYYFIIKINKFLSYYESHFSLSLFCGVSLYIIIILILLPHFQNVFFNVYDSVSRIFQGNSKFPSI